MERNWPLEDDGSDNALRRPLTIALQERLAETGDPHLLTETVLETLGELGLIAYAPKGTLRLLSAPGRVLVAVMERPDITLRELAAYLGVTESNVAKSVSALVRANVITRTKVKNRNRYRLNLKEAMYHPDIRRFHAAISTRFEAL